MHSHTQNSQNLKHFKSVILEVEIRFSTLCIQILLRLLYYIYVYWGQTYNWAWVQGLGFSFQCTTTFVISTLSTTTFTIVAASILATTVQAASFMSAILCVTLIYLQVWSFCMQRPFPQEKIEFIAIFIFIQVGKKKYKRLSPHHNS